MPQVCVYVWTCKAGFKISASLMKKASTPEGKSARWVSQAAKSTLPIVHKLAQLHMMFVGVIL